MKFFWDKDSWISIKKRGSKVLGWSFSLSKKKVVSDGLVCGLQQTGDWADNGLVCELCYKLKGTTQYWRSDRTRKLWRHNRSKGLKTTILTICTALWVMFRPSFLGKKSSELNIPALLGCRVKTRANTKNVECLNMRLFLKIYINY